MPESVEHAELVTLIVDHVRHAHRGELGLSLLVDSANRFSGDKPSRIGGFCPDVEVRTVPSSFVLIGEAKSFGDLSTTRTRKQLSAFLEFLSMQSDSTLVMAVPLAALPPARALVTKLKAELRAGSVKTSFLYR